MRTFYDAKSEECYTTVIFRDTQTKEQTALKINTSDIGIAVVEGFIHLRNFDSLHQHKAIVAKCSEDVEPISNASNYLLKNHLTTEENRLLVAAFISLYNEEAMSVELGDIEKELLEEETVYNSEFADLKSVYRFIWRSHSFQECMFASDFLTGNQFRVIKDSIGADDRDSILCWSTLLCFWSGHDGMHPYTLFKGIIEGDYTSYIASPTNKQFLHDLFLT